MRRALLALPFAAGLLAFGAPTATADPLPSLATSASAKSADACVWVTVLNLGICVPDNLFDGLPDLP